jgi:excisionase family DNA binding protein
MSPYMDVQECAVYIKLARKTIYNLVQKGELPARKHGRRLIFFRPDIDEWSASRIKQPKEMPKSRFQLARERIHFGSRRSA